MSELERRDVVLSSPLQRHQLRVYMVAHGIKWSWKDGDPGQTFTISATPEQWTAINQWIEKTKVEP